MTININGLYLSINFSIRGQVPSDWVKAIIIANKGKFLCIIECIEIMQWVKCKCQNKKAGSWILISNRMRGKVEVLHLTLYHQTYILDKDDKDCCYKWHYTENKKQSWLQIKSILGRSDGHWWNL